MVLKTWAGEIKLQIDENNIEIRPNDNGKSITDLRLKNGQALTVYKNEKAPVIEQANLIEANGDMNPKCAIIVKRWFD